MTEDHKETAHSRKSHHVFLKKLFDIVITRSALKYMRKRHEPLTRLLRIDDILFFILRSPHTRFTVAVLCFGPLVNYDPLGDRINIFPSFRHNWITR